MASSSDLSEFSVNDDTKDNDIKAITAKLRPDWSSDALKIDMLSGGFQNKVYHVYLPDLPRKDGLVFRVFSSQFKQLMIREKEVLGLRLAHKVGCGTNFYGEFQNGVVLGFCPGRTLTHDDFHNPEFNKHIAKACAKFNHISQADIDALSEKKIFDAKTDRQTFMAGVRGMIEFAPERSDPEMNKKAKELFPPRSELLKEYDFVMEFLESLDMPTVFSHNDIQVKNCMWDPDEQKIILVDFESVNFNYQYSDVGKHFHFLPYYYLFGFATKEQCQETPADSVVRGFLRSYLETMFELDGKSPELLTEDDVTELKYQVDICSILFDVMSMCVGAVTDMPNMDTFSIACLGKERYFSRKNKIIELGKQYIDFKKAKHDKEVTHL